MAFEGTYLAPTMVINDTVTRVTREIWAQRKLSAEDFAKFTAALAREEAIWAAEEASGNVTRTPIFETVDGKSRYVGSTTTLTTHVESDAEFAEFMRQYLSDPDVTWPAGRKPTY